MSTFYLEQISKTGNLEANWFPGQNKPVLLSQLLEPKSNSPKIRQDQKAKLLGYSSSDLKRSKHDPICKVLMNQVVSKEIEPLNRPQMTSKDLKKEPFK